ncbi:hypothetical protein M0805_007453 [Coniferiporia weirii]|nr:hypothetical protein M0805_007453 [Coniferiporia weirii]
MSAATTKGTDASMWARRADDSTRSWRSEKEPGAAFRGGPRGRGRGGGRTRAGGRGGGTPSGRGPADKNEALKSEVSAKIAIPIGHKATDSSDTSPTPPTPERLSISSTGTSNSTAQSKGRGPTRGPPRPTLTIEPMSPLAADTSTPLSPSKPSSRRRRNGHKHAPSTTIPSSTLAKPLPSALASGFPTSPLASEPQTASKDPKDLPPHLVGVPNPVPTVHDLRKDIFNLVEHVRSVAMDAHRPSSPSTHIDWAGDDDDSLPDLDDWGVSSKLISEAGSATKTETDSVSMSVTSQDPASVPETEEAVEQTSSHPPPAGAEQSSNNNPKDSAAPAAVPVKKERERRRERGSRKDKERRALNAASTLQVKGPVGAPSLTGFAKKSLLERLSSPVRSGPVTNPARPDMSLSKRSIQPVIEPKSPPPHPPHHSLPPKPANGFENHRLPARSTGSWGVDLPKDSPPEENKSVPQASKATVAPVPKEEPAVVTGEAADSSDNPAHPTTETKEPPAAYGGSFDWSEEPTPFDGAVWRTAESLEVGVEPPTPLEENATPDVSTPIATPAVTSTRPSARVRSQRPLSTDVTPHSRRDHSPHKTHNARNHSAPHVGPGPAATRTRAPHTTRPVIRMDALAMISRSLRETTTTPPRHKSPAPAPA